MRAEFAPLTRELAEEFYGSAPPFSLRGFAVTVDAALVGLFGVYYERPTTIVAFSDFTSPDILAPRDRVRAGKHWLQFIRDRALPVIAYAKSPRDRGFLEHLGFEFITTTEYGDVMTWGP